MIVRENKGDQRNSVLQSCTETLSHNNNENKYSFLDDIINSETEIENDTCSNECICSVEHWE